MFPQMLSKLRLSTARSFSMKPETVMNDDEVLLRALRDLLWTGTGKAAFLLVLQG